MAAGRRVLTPTDGNTELDASEVPFSFKDAPCSVDSRVHRVHDKAGVFVLEAGPIS